MNKKKLIVLIIAIIAIFGLSYFVIKLMKTDGRSMTELIDFSVEDTASIDKLIISDAFGNTFEVKRTSTGWVDAKDGCIVQEHVKIILETVKRIKEENNFGGNKEAGLDVVAKLIDEGICCSIKYAVVRDEYLAMRQAEIDALHGRARADSDAP